MSCVLSVSLYFSICPKKRGKFFPWELHLPKISFLLPNGLCKCMELSHCVTCFLCKRYKEVSFISHVHETAETGTAENAQRARSIPSLRKGNFLSIAHLIAGSPKPAIRDTLFFRFEFSTGCESRKTTDRRKIETKSEKRCFLRKMAFSSFLKNHLFLYLF